MSYVTGIQLIPWMFTIGSIFTGYCMNTTHTGEYLSRLPLIWLSALILIFGLPTQLHLMPHHISYVDTCRQIAN